MQIDRKATLLDQIDVTYGPPNLLSRFFLRAVEVARERGVELRFATFDELLAINKKNSESWRPLASAFDPGKADLAVSNSFCVVGEDSAGEIVATHAIRLFDWRRSNLKIEAEALRLFYDDPTRAAPGEACLVNAPSAALVSGLVAYSGGAWYRRDFRSGRLSTILPRLTRTISLARWNVDFVAAIMAERTIAAGFAQRSGYSRIEWDMVRTNAPAFKAETSVLRLGVMFMDASEMVDSAFGWLIEVDAQVNRAVGSRRA